MGKGRGRWRWVVTDGEQERERGRTLESDGGCRNMGTGQRGNPVAIDVLGTPRF